MPRAKTPEEDHNVKVSISFTPEHMRELLLYCQRNERSMSWVIRKALDEWFDKHKGDHL